MTLLQELLEAKAKKIQLPSKEEATNQLAKELGGVVEGGHVKVKGEKMHLDIEVTKVGQPVGSLPRYGKTERDPHITVEAIPRFNSGERVGGTHGLDADGVDMIAYQIKKQFKLYFK